MPQDREQALLTLNALAQKYGERAEHIQDANEADTRLKVIDAVLVLLGWDKDEFNPERSIGGGYTDYILSADGIPRLIVEAKRVGHTFGKPRSGLKKLEYTFSYICNAYGKALNDVLEQARKYCEETRIPYAILTNGFEWLLLQLIPPPGRSLSDLKCFYFGDLLSEDHSFDLLWQLVSKQGVLANALEEEFSTLNRLEADYSVEPRTMVGDIHWASETDVEVHLRDFYHLFFDEITDPGRRKMLEHCFVTNTRLDQYTGVLKRALEDIAPAYVGNAQELKPSETGNVLPTRSGDQKGRVVLVTGSVGAGKTTFVTKVVIEHRGEALFFVIVDLINESDDEISASKLWQLASEKWGEKYAEYTEYRKLREIFHSDLERLKKGPKSPIFQEDLKEYQKAEAELLTQLSENPEILMKRTWQCLRSQRKGVVLFLDNTDRASESYQKAVYSFAHKVSAETGATVIVPMRESTFFRAKESGFLDVRTTDLVFHLQAPDPTQIISRRIKYVESQLREQDKEPDHRLSDWKAASDWPLFQKRALSFADTLRKTFLQSTDGKDAIGLLAVIAWHNVRDLLRILRQLHASLGTPSEPWRTYEIVASLLLSGEHEGTRHIPSTLYRPISKKHHCYYLKLRLLLFVEYGVTSSDRRRGVSGQRFLAFAQGYGYRKQWIKEAITELVHERLLECLEIPTERSYTSKYAFSHLHSYRISPLALLLLEKIQFEPVYLAVAGWELPIQRPEWLQRFIQEVRRITSRTSGLSRDSLNVLISSDLPKIVSSYIQGMLTLEKLPSSHLTAQADVAATEEKVRAVAGELARIAPAAEWNEDVEDVIEETSPVQISLFPDEGDGDKLASVTPIAFPKNIHAAKLDNVSHNGALILWALVTAKANALGGLNATEGATLINSFVDDHRRVEPTNIARALRSKSMVRQKWLKVAGPISQKRYSLGETWADAWKTIYEENPPDL